MNIKNRIPYLVLIATLAVPGTLWAEEQTFHFQDPKGVNSIGIFLDSLLEPFHGSATKISGEVTFDPKKPKSLSGKIVVDSSSVQMTNSAMTKALHGADWLDVSGHPKIEAKFVKLVSVKKLSKNKFQLKVKGTLTIKGVTKSLTIPVTLEYLENQQKARNHAGSGHLLVVRSNITINRKDFGIKPEMGPTVVAEKIQLNVAIVGFSK